MGHVQDHHYQIARHKIAQGDWIPDPEVGVIRNREGRTLGVVKSNGYRHLRIQHQGQRHDVMAHRVIYEHVYGPVGRNLVVHHRDANRDHNAIGNLEAVTQRQNRLYAYQAGRIPTKLRPDQVDALRVRWNSGESIKKLAADFGINAQHAGDIVRGRSWGWLLLPVTVAHTSPALSLPAAA